MTDVTGYRPNKTLIPSILEACEQDGMGWYGKWRVSRALRRLSEADLLKLEQKCTALATEASLPMGTDDIVGGCYVGDWGDGTFFQMLIDALPKILEFIKALLPLFMLFASIIVAFFVFAATAEGQCPGGVCQRPVQAVKKTVTKVVQKATVRESRRVHVLRLFRQGR
jgi:hypothetical protein